MKEIKFRAWDGQKMIYDGDKVWPDHLANMRHYLSGASVTNKGVEVWVYESQLPHATDKHFDHRTGIPFKNLMQFTGLCDKNGKEIFEGDIVEQESIITYPGEYGGEIDLLYTGEVVIIPSKGACLKRPNVIDRLEEDRKWKCNSYKNVVSYRCEIIGNIFENPELLKEDA